MIDNIKLKYHNKLEAEECMNAHVNHKKTTCKHSYLQIKDS